MYSVYGMHIVESCWNDGCQGGLTVRYLPPPPSPHQRQTDGGMGIERGISQGSTYIYPYICIKTETFPTGGQIPIATVLQLLA